MSRNHRIQFPDAIYHVFSRGNYRQNIFEDEGAAKAFEQCLFEACDLSSWRLHGFSIMRNHFHLGLQTPRANLAKGMHWLQSTYSKRFNCFRRENGHLFQSRYHALLVEPGHSLARVVNYIHLNPVKAHIVPIEDLPHFRWSSYRLFISGNRPSFLICNDWLAALGMEDTPDGWKSYHHYLAWLAADKAEQNRLGFDKLATGWAIGSTAWQQNIIGCNKGNLTHGQIEVSANRELKETAWSLELTSLLLAAGHSREEVRRDRKGALWKISLAQQLRRKTSATNAWIARELSMGSPQSLSVYLSKSLTKFKN